MFHSIDHAVAIFASRESAEVLRATVAAATVASERASVGKPGCRSVIDVLINGNPALAEAVAQHASARVLDTTTAPLLRIWRVAVADKAHTWNQYVETIWPASRLAFFVDGYVRLWPGAIQHLGSRVDASATALGGSGVPTAGRSAAAAARAMLRDGGLQGNFFCLTRDVLVEMRRLNFRLPLGLYRGDSLIGAALAYRLNPAMNRWDLKSTVVVEPEASWDLQVPRIWRPSDWRARWRRMDRQAGGTLENLAVRDHLLIASTGASNAATHRRRARAGLG